MPVTSLDTGTDWINRFDPFLTKFYVTGIILYTNTKSTFKNES